jgi:Lysylphosphatidylglycerol synthase TM region
VVPTSSRRLTAAGAVTAALGVAALIWQLRGVNPREIWDGLYGVGWGVLVVLVLGGLRFALRAAAWSRSVEPPARLAFGDAFAAVVAGDALGNLTPLGPIVGEPAKAAFVRGRLDLTTAVTALAVENLYYTLSVAAMIAAGTVALLFSFELPGDVRYTSEIALAIIVALFAGTAWLLWRRPALITRALSALARRGATFAGPARLERVRRLEHEIYSFSSRRRDALAPIVAMEIAFHALGVLEIYVTLLLLPGPSPSLLQAFVLEGANRLINVVFKFVPLRVGVDEAGTEWLTRILGAPPGLGAQLALVRKLRMVFWSVAGGILLVRHGLSTRRILDDPRLARARE